MKSIAVYNMKGGVGKTTTAVNLSYLAAAAGQRALLWDLDPQAASTFAFRIRPRVAGFGKKSLESGEALGAAIKATDYNNLDVLPADFAYRKFDRLLDQLVKPKRVVASLLETLGGNYDLVFLDCPAGFSLLTEGVFNAVDAVLVPTIPTVLSLRTVARAIKCAERADSPFEFAAFFSMVDRRKTLHRRACEWSADHPEIFLTGQIPYASIVEQMAVRRAPLPVFAARDTATTAFEAIWTELGTRMSGGAGRSADQAVRWQHGLQAIESLIERLESSDEQERDVSGHAPIAGAGSSHWARRRTNLEVTDPHVVHRFDTERQDLQRSGHVLELREGNGRMLVIVARSGNSELSDMTRRAEVQVDSSWAVDILSGVMSPFEALERRLGRPGPRLVEHVRAIVGERRLLRIESRIAEQTESESHAPLYTGPVAVPSTIRQAG